MDEIERVDAIRCTMIDSLKEIILYNILSNYTCAYEIKFEILISLSIIFFHIVCYLHNSI